MVLYIADDGLRGATWPSDGFSILKPRDGCPDGFKEGSLVMGVPGADHSEQYHLDTESTDDELTVRFCTKKQTTGGDTEWEPGQYCILRTDRKCPNGKVLCNLIIRKSCQWWILLVRVFLFPWTGFEDGQIVIDNEKNPHVASLPLPDVDVDKNVRLNFCCRNDGSWFDQIYLPRSQPFVLFERGYECQEVKGNQPLTIK